MAIIYSCISCEYNHDGICSEEGLFGFNADVSNKAEVECQCWEPSTDYHNMIMDLAPWFITEPFKICKIDYATFLKHLHDYQNGTSIPINLYDAIEKEFELNHGELAEILKVSQGVIGSARFKNTPEKRIADFSAKLQLPTYFFSKFTSEDLPELANAKQQFYRIYGEKIQALRKRLKDERDNPTRGVPAFSPSYMWQKVRKYYANREIYDGPKDDYKSWDFVVEVGIVDGEYFGAIYDEHYSTVFPTEHELQECVNEIVDCISCEEIDALNEEGLLINTIALCSDSDGSHIRFVLKNSAGSSKEYYILAEEFSKYLDKASLIQCTGHGKKKELRKCISCKNYKQMGDTAKGICIPKGREVQRSRTVCPYYYVPILSE